MSSPNSKLYSKFKFLPSSSRGCSRYHRHLLLNLSALPFKSLPRVSDSSSAASSWVLQRFFPPETSCCGSQGSQRASPPDDLLECPCPPASAFNGHTRSLYCRGHAATGRKGSWAGTLIKRPSPGLPGPKKIVPTAYY